MASTTDGPTARPSQVAMTRPSTSPMTQPVRQCVVAWAASRLTLDDADAWLTDGAALGHRQRS